jgi:predicted regulator of Ras-like GTPase activity (Roadblock/LC7/MglB family)
MIKKYLTDLLQSVNGCSAILVYDTNKESNPIFRVGELNDNETNAIKQNIGVFNSSIERAEKLCKTSSSKTIMAFYNNHQLFIFSKKTIVFIVVATPEANAGSLLNLKTYLDPIVSEFLATNSLESAANFSSSVPSSSTSNLFSQAQGNLKR